MLSQRLALLCKQSYKSGSEIIHIQSPSRKMCTNLIIIIRESPESQEEALIDDQWCMKNKNLFSSHKKLSDGNVARIISQPVMLHTGTCPYCELQDFKSP